uniref:Reverse transcriptase domain-containing protein n=1 Tax=Periophthalmus magnuspinnatus TaxID=409849 RepID=A0A3B3ZBG8_9GOBI
LIKLDKNNYVGAVFLDLRKAFDVVNHTVLLSKLYYFNFSDSAIKWMASYLSNRKQCTVVNGVKSSFVDCPLGVPQGSILGPILFSLFINDLPDVCEDVDIQLYADDAVIYTSAKSPEEAAQTLSSALRHIQSWLTRSCLLLNTQKTVFVLMQNVLSFKGCVQWNSLPTFVREAPTFTTFKRYLKEWLRSTQTCEHNS